MVFINKIYYIIFDYIIFSGGIKNMKSKIAFFILLILAGFVFYLGWTQIKIKPGTFGVVQSKIGGINQKAVIPGEFSWNWDFLIPTNAKLTVFDSKPVNKTTKISVNFQSYDLNGNYSDYLNYYFNCSISLSFTPEAVVSLLQDNYVSDDEDLHAYLSNVADSLAQMATDYYLRRSMADSSFNPQSVKRDEIISAIASYKDFPEIDVTIFALTDFKLPNYNLYNKQKNMLTPYESYGSSSTYSSSSSSYGTSGGTTGNSDESTNENEADTKDNSSKSTNILGLEL